MASALALAACGGDDDAATADTAEPASAAMSAADTADGGDGGDGFIASDDGGDRAAADRPSEGGFDIGVVGRDVIIEMRVVVSSDDIERTVASVMASAATLGGGVASSDVNYGNDAVGGSDGYAVLVVKVPPESVDRLLSGLDDSGTVQSINQSAQDVTEQLVNLDVRIRNARQSVANVREFMDRTENLNELVTLEAELTRRQTELEQLEAQERNLTDRVALSTITIEVIPTASVPEPPVEPEPNDGIGDAFESGWEAFTALLFGIGFVVAATLPFLVSGLLLALLAWAIIRRRDGRRPPASHPATDESAVEEPAVEEPAIDDTRTPIG
ncbi:MAG: DUF4349 domain-containing protein [Ilumatobacteraceae bacterium]|nr:DUF4349 domain-containing protein [Ilumatobacteraceae bacterium]